MIEVIDLRPGYGTKGTLCTIIHYCTPACRYSVHMYVIHIFVNHFILDTKSFSCMNHDDFDDFNDSTR